MNRWTTPFAGNPIAIQAHLLGKEYGMTPTDVLNRPAWQFWMDARIRTAGTKWEAEQREQARNSGDAGVASGQEKQDLVESQEDRADRRESQDGQPSMADQLDALKGQDGSGGPTDG